MATVGGGRAPRGGGGGARGAGGAGGAGGRRTRSLLSSYYGVGLEAQPAAAAAVLDPSNIDSAVFSADKYLGDLLGKKDLRSLIKIDNDLLAETKKLDSDMKTLVYENYNKFISATDTIRQMKSNVVNMEEEIKRLAENMGKISVCSDQISGTLSSRREKIEELSGVYRLLKRRQFLFELPSRLNRCLEMEAFAQAAEYYTGASGILRKFQHLPSFQSIQTECDLVISKLKTVLKEKMLSNSNEDKAASLPPPLVAEFISVLLDLNESVHTLRNDYLNAKEKVFRQRFLVYSNQSTQFLQRQQQQHQQEQTTTEAEEVKEERKLEEGNEENNKKTKKKKKEEGEVSLDKFLSEMLLSFLADFLEFCSTFQTLFLQRSSLSRDSIHQSKLKLDEFTKTLFNDFLVNIKTLLLETEAVKGEEIIQGLEIVYRSLSNVHNQFSDLNIADRGTEIVNNVVHTRIERAFDAIQAFISEHLKGVALSLSGSGDGGMTASNKTLNEICTQTYEALIECIKTKVLWLRPFFSVTERHLDFLASHNMVFVAKFGVKIQQLFLTLNIMFSDYLDNKNKDVVMSPKFLLLLSKLALRFEMSGVSEVYDLAVNVVSHKQQEDLNINTTDLVQRLASIAQKVLGQYMKVQGQKISQLIRKGIETPDWLSPKLKEPRDVRLVVMIVSEIDSIHKEVSQLFDDSLDDDSSTSSSSSSKRNNIFNKKVKVSDEIQFNRNAILGGITTIFLKSFFECCRLRMFGKFGLQQIQVETAYMRVVLRKFVGNNNSNNLDALLDEVLSSTAERCIEPILMEKNIVHSICEKRIKSSS